VICPACGAANLPGDDECGQCGADLRAADLPDPDSRLETRLLADTLAHVRRREPLFVSSDTPLRVAVRLMQDERATCLLVGEGRHLEGILTERNLLLRAAGRPLEGLRVADVMTPDPVVLRGDDSVAVAIHKMAVGGFRHMPLVEEGRVTGIVSAPDLFRHMLGILGA
jgi:CBS domain-containing protein